MVLLQDDARQEFERRAASIGYHIEKRGDYYKNGYKHGMWTGWQMRAKFDLDRAALASRDVSPSDTSPKPPDDEVIEFTDSSAPALIAATRVLAASLEPGKAQDSGDDSVHSVGAPAETLPLGAPSAQGGGTPCDPSGG